MPEPFEFLILNLPGRVADAKDLPVVATAAQAAAWYAAGATGVALDAADASWNALAQRYRTVPGIVHGLRAAVREHILLAKKHARLEPLADAGLDARVVGLHDALPDGPTAFSGITDGRGAAMAAVLAAPLAEKGVRVGILADAAIADEGARIIGELAAPFEPARVEELPPAKPFDVAIIGMGCLLPKAPNVRAFWANILNKVDAIGDVPKERFNIDAYYDPDRKAKDKIHSKWGGFLDAVPFDPMRYGIPPNALPSIDPLQLLALVTVDQALRDAGYGDGDFPRQKTSVILGLSGGLGDVGLQYAVRSMLPQFIAKPPAELLAELPEWTEDSFAGLLLNVAAGRVANRFDLGGVNFSVDAACASSLAAVYLAARELADHASDMAIVGGVDTAQSPFGFLCFAKAQALSGRGRCRTFDESADGIAISEGISMMVLKRLEDAERDGDRIYAVIKGVQGSSDGKGKSMTAPRLEGQILALQRAYAQAGVRPSTVGLIEAHGTGTTLGDASELNAVAEVFKADGAAPQGCAIGSVKSMVGHTKSAAGITGLMKVALALYHKTLPATLHVEKPNQKLLEPGIPMFVNTETLPWIPPAGVARRGGVSAFGFGGTNFHAVLEEFQGDLTDPADVAQTEKWPAELYIWNDPTAADLVEGRGVGTRVSASAKTRLAIVATSPEDLRAKLAKAKPALEAKQPLNDAQGIWLAYGPARGKVAFLFPGQGSQKTHMLRELALNFPEFRASFETAEQTLAGRFPKKLAAYIYPPPVFAPEQGKQQELELTDTVVAQPALGVVEIGLTRTLERLGVRPDMTAGHSYGEYAALAAAGVISDGTLFDLSEARGRAIKDTTQDEAGTMAAVSADPDAITKALDGMEGITLANHNSPRQTVISGSNAAVKAAMVKLEAAGLAARSIPVACAFHSPLMEPARVRFAEVLARQAFAKPTAAVYSNTLGGRYPSEPSEMAELLASHLVRPVKFVDEIRAMYEDGARVFVEVGPKGVLTGLARQILDGKDARLIQIDSDKGGLVALLNALGQLAAEGVPMDAAQLLRGRVVPAEPAVRDSGWMVNGLKAFPRIKPPQVVMPLDLVLRSSIPVVAVPAPAVSLPPAPVAAPVVVTSGASDTVMLQFQQLMKQVLESQTAIMTAYLGGGAPVAMALPALPAPAPVAAPAPISAPVAPPPPPPVAPVVVATASAGRDFVTELRAVAAERTGYPPEMLDLDAGIESDLGIDSIKRVEILTALQKLGSAEQQQNVQAIMPKLTGARTLREIAELIAGCVQAERPLPDGRGSVLEELRAVAAERTGYPPEMLDLDAGIESDLGIDSIKRVEILTALQKLGSAEQQQNVQAIMPKLTGARTLREIAELIAGCVQAERPLPDGRGSVLEELRAVAAERTGYPPEMLELDAGIESDLGIDSIKRVEILTALQKLGSAEQQSAVQGIMGKLTAARTLREIADLIAGCAGGAERPLPDGRGSVLEELRAVAAERTGYPPEMLDLDAGIESDLGIDSIKRVEILTALQKLGSAEQQSAVQGIMGKLTAARTLREIADLIAGCAGGAERPLPDGRGSVLEELRAVAAERTGYPPEMLDLDAGIESDLGIDSIKRVEILTALQKLGSAEQQSAVQGIMNKLTSARTLREIADLIAGCAGGAERPLPDGRGSVLEELRAVAAERTGYPPEMLDLDAGIESDLGIDSIKRVEILTALQKLGSAEQQAAVQGIMNKLTSARTLREIAALIEGSTGPEVPRFILTVAEQPRLEPEPHYYPGRVCVITDDETGIAAGLADELNRHGERAVVVRHLTDPAAVESVIGGIRKQHGPIGAIIHLLPLKRGVAPEKATFAEWRGLVQADVRSLYLLARACESDLKQTGAAGGAMLAAITARGGVFGLQPNGPFSPTHFAVADFVKTLALEFDGVRCKVVDLDATDPVPILRQKLIDELTSPNETLQVGLPGDRRLTVVPQIAPLDGSVTRQIQSDWVILLTGGARGVTAEIARQLAERCQPTLILAGASALPAGDEPADTAGITEIPKLKAALLARLRAASSNPVKPAAVEAALQRLLKDREITASIEGLRKAGAKVEYHAVDVRNEEAFGALIDRIYQEHGRLDVVIHGAGIIEDKLIKDKTPESFDRVVHTKADAVFVLSRKLRAESLKCLLLMSSVTAAFGNRGQADYAAANGVMNGLAVILSGQWPGRVVAMNWGPWASSGMVSEEVRQQFLARGIQMIPLDGGAQAALREIEAGPQSEPLVAMGEGPWRGIALPAGTPRLQVATIGSVK